MFEKSWTQFTDILHIHSRETEERVVLWIKPVTQLTLNPLTHQIKISNDNGDVALCTNLHDK